MLMKQVRILFFSLICFLSLIFIPHHLTVHSESHPNRATVYYIPVEKAVEKGLEEFMKRSFQEAIEAGADHIILEIDTPGGLVDPAGNIARLLRETEIPITAFIRKEAISAGAYIALNADRIVFTPGATMGAAQVIEGNGNAAEDKVHSYWVKEMEESAKLRGRDPIYARAMAETGVELKGIAHNKNGLLTIGAEDALRVGYAEAIAKDREELLQFLEVENPHEVEVKETFAEQIARFVTHPVVIPILLSIGSLGLVLELYSPGFGVPGIMGISALLLFFFGHFIAGLAGLESILLFVVGAILIIIEIFVAGFGLFGLLGVGSIIGSMLLASQSFVQMTISILIAVVVTAVATFITLKYFGNRGPMKRLVLTAATTTEEGYISNVSRTELVGEIGKTVTPLRPAGSMIVNGERLDVISEGDYIEQGRKVRIIRTSGIEIVVREVESDEQ